MMDNNYQYSKELLHYCLDRRSRSCMPLLPATYGGRSDNFIEDRQYEKPLKCVWLFQIPV